MKKILFLMLAGCLLMPRGGACTEKIPQAIGDIAVLYDKTIKGFAHPESVAFEPHEKVLYVGQFGPLLRPTFKDGKGKISKVSLTGRVMVDRFLPDRGDVLNKPKGIHVKGSRLWVTDIDVVWVFDLKTRRGRKVRLPGAKFANDPVVVRNMLFVSDTMAGLIYRVEPADFLEPGIDPKVGVFSSGLAFGPNGLCRAKRGFLYVVGYDMGGKDRGIYSVDAGGGVKAITKDIGMLDGIAQLRDGTLLITDWKSRSLFRWSREEGQEILARGFQGPADFCLVPKKTGLMVVIPDLVRNELRMIGITR